ncbi:MAG: hypothetical protein II574_05860 [Ruminococcus sp.]|nr:hypothetical protein [Ruminococcus sp.]
MSNRLFAAVLSAVLALACLTACTESSSSVPENTQTKATTTTTTSAETTASSKTAHKDEVDLTYFFEQVCSKGYAPEGTYEGTRVYDGGAGLCVEFHGKSKNGGTGKVYSGNIDSYDGELDGMLLLESLFKAKAEHLYKSGECFAFTKGAAPTMKECYLLAAVMSDYQLSGRFYFPA